MKRRIVFVSVLLLAGLTACGTQPAAIRLPMGFVANVQFAPVYVAVEKGYFAEEGIELTFDYSWETDGVRLVGAGELPFAIASGDQVLLAREKELPVVTFINWWRRFPVAIVALEECGIEQPRDLAGRTVGIPETFGASFIGWRAFASAVELDEGDVTLEPIGYTQLANLTEERIDAAVVYANNEPVQLTQMGRGFVQFSVADYAALVSNGFITNEETLQENPKLVRAFARAFLKGLEDTLADPDMAFDVCRTYVEGLDENEAAQRAVLEASLRYWEANVLGESDPAAWQTTADVMLDAGLLSTAVDAGRAYTNDYLP
jgi:NitT/TauT family transport system substrate-binding protein